MLQQRQLQQRRHIAHQLGGNDKDQDGDQHGTQRNGLYALDALHRGAGIPQRNVVEEAERGVDLRPQHNHRHQRNQRQNRADQPQRLRADRIQIDNRLFDFHSIGADGGLLLFSSSLRARLASISARR